MGTGEVSADHKLLALVNNTLEAQTLDGWEHFFRSGHLVFDLNPRRGQFQRVQYLPAFFKRQAHSIATLVYKKIEHEVMNAGRFTKVVLEEIELRFS